MDLLKQNTAMSQETMLVVPRGKYSYLAILGQSFIRHVLSSHQSSHLTLKCVVCSMYHHFVFSRDHGDGWLEPPGQREVLSVRDGPVHWPPHSGHRQLGPGLGVLEVTTGKCRLRSIKLTFCRHELDQMCPKLMDGLSCINKFTVRCVFRKYI